MKKIFFAISLIFAFGYLSATIANAASTTPTPTSAATQAPNQQILNNLQERIASRVAQLNLVEKKGIIGTVTDIAETQMTLTDNSGNTTFIDVDELTNFSSPSAKSSFGISDITKGSTVGVLGLYNKESRRILARFVDVLLLPKVISGETTAIDSKNYVITVTTPDGKDVPVEIQDVTKTYVFGKDTGLIKSGFSKIQQGERVLVVGFPDTQNPGQILASRILRFPTLTVNPRIVLLKPNQANITPATGSGTKIVPIIKAQ